MDMKGSDFLTVEKVKDVFGIFIDGQDDESSGKLNLPHGITVEVDVFVRLFKNAENVTYNELVSIDQGKMGYTPFFDECKEKDILN